ncbi:MAG TPA: DUF4013 domain-containing protein [archaeon]|nr:DUF4013 domain-containing protein [archaeon]
MKIVDALRKPFTDWGKLAIGSLLGLVPVANLAVMGYGLQNAKLAVGKHAEDLPSFSFESWILGLKCAVVGGVYGFFNLLVLLPFIGTSLMTRLALYTPGDPMWPMVATIVTSSLVIIPITLLMVPVHLAARLRLAQTESLAVAFRFREVFRLAYNSSFIRNFLVAGLLNLAIAIVMSFIPVVGWAVAGYVTMVCFWTYVGANTPAVIK